MRRHQPQRQRSSSHTSPTPGRAWLSIITTHTKGGTSGCCQLVERVQHHKSRRRPENRHRPERLHRTTRYWTFESWIAGVSLRLYKHCRGSPPATVLSRRRSPSYCPGPLEPCHRQLFLTTLNSVSGSSYPNWSIPYRGRGLDSRVVRHLCLPVG